MGALTDKLDKMLARDHENGVTRRGRLTRAVALIAVPAAAVLVLEQTPVAPIQNTREAVTLLSNVPGNVHDSWVDSPSMQDRKHDKKVESMAQGAVTAVTEAKLHPEDVSTGQFVTYVVGNGELASDIAGEIAGPDEGDPQRVIAAVDAQRTEDGMLLAGQEVLVESAAVNLIDESVAERVQPYNPTAQQ